MIVIGSDHTGPKLKKKIIEHLKSKDIDVYDASDFKTQDGDDYPDIAQLICNKVLEDSKNIGIAICGTGIGISIACNKINGIRAALCNDIYVSEMSRKHNNANVLCLGARTKFVENIQDVFNIVDVFISTDFEEGRHLRRIQKIADIEKINKKVD